MRFFTWFHIFHKTRLPYRHRCPWARPFHLLQPQHNNNAQGGAKASAATVNTKDSSIASAQHDGVQNGARVHPQLHGGSDTPVASTLPGQLKLQPLREAPELFQRLRLLSQRSSRTFPKAPTSQRSSRTVPKVPRALTSQEHPLR
ncbi:hypothetical protein ACFX2J_027622 [Malus domestica]